MFGLVLPPHPLQTPTPLSPTQQALTLPLPPSPHPNNLTLFLLPTTTLPPSTLAAIYIQRAPSQSFTLLGALSNEAPSATFRLPPNDNAESGAGGNANGERRTEAEEEDDMIDAEPALPPTIIPSPAAAAAEINQITIGISIEPAAAVEAQLAALPPPSPPPQQPTPSTALVPTAAAAARRPISTKVLAQRIVQNAFNFLASFGEKGVGGQEVVPLGRFREWWGKFERRVEADEGFLLGEDGVV